MLRRWKKERGSLALALARDDARVFGTLEDQPLHPERFSRTFRETLARYGRALGDSAPPMIRLHDYADTCVISTSGRCSCSAVVSGLKMSA
jgi:hypothetical protein